MSTLCVKRTREAQQGERSHTTRRRQCHTQALGLETSGTCIKLYM